MAKWIILLVATILIMFSHCANTKKGKIEIKFDYDVIEQLIKYQRNNNVELLNDIVNLAAYKLVYKHSKHFSSTPLNEDKLKNQILELINDLPQNYLGETLSYLKSREDYYKNKLTTHVLEYLPDGITSPVTIYYIVGGYNGIALDRQVAMSVTYPQFVKDIKELEMYLPHELFHIGFEQYHALPNLKNIKTCNELKEVVQLVTLNEGIATLVPYKIRHTLGILDDTDYKTLDDNELLQKKVVISH